VRRRNGGRDALAIPIDHRRRDVELPDIAGLGAGEAKRGDMGREPRRPYRKFELL
jgi:hypothetical protein